MIDAIILTGPTASGKSQAALELASYVQGEIINADSMQLYKHLPILTACPNKKDKALVSHHLYEILGDDDLGSVGWWHHQVCDLIKQIRSRDCLPILVGGTGLYLSTLERGLFEIPIIPESIRNQVRDWAEKENFHTMVSYYDPLAAGKLHPHDKQRLARALEVYLTTGKSIDIWKANPLKKNIFSLLKVALVPDRDQLYDHIDQRFDVIMAKGALKEVDHLRQRPIRLDSPILRAVGVPELMSFLRGEGLSQEEAVKRAKQSSRNYAKRQYTWIRHQALEYTCFSGWSTATLKTILSTIN